MMHNDILREVRDRTRRIETRLTKWLEAEGFETKVQRPVWRGDGRLDVPTRSCSLADCLSVVPPDWPGDEEIGVFCNGEFIVSLFTAPPA